jgi:hypothetical protein
MGMVGFVAVLHGHAHGAEMPELASGADQEMPIKAHYILGGGLWSVLNESRQSRPSQCPPADGTAILLVPGPVPNSKQSPYRLWLRSTQQCFLPPGAAVSAVPSERFRRWSNLNFAGPLARLFLFIADAVHEVRTPWLYRHSLKAKSNSSLLSTRWICRCQRMAMVQVFHLVLGLYCSPERWQDRHH